jgi:hypothetical protein
MATTTNYGWTTPDDTALVKDGASAIRSLGSAIDTTVFNNAGAAIAKTIVDAKGDIIAATAADTVSRLAVGANDTVLTADSSTATGLKWASPSSGGMTLISTTSLSGSSSISLSSIPSTYINLHLVIIDASVATGGNWRLYVTPPSGSVYAVGITGGNTPQQQNAVTNIGETTIYADTATKAGYYLTISQYASSTYRKFFHLFGSHGTSQTNGVIEGGWIDSTSAISSLTITNSTPTNFDAGTALLYGVK